MTADQRERARLARLCTQSLREFLLGFRSVLANALRDEGLTLPTLKLLNAIQERGSVSGASIARTCHVTPQTLQVMLTRAEREGWITRDTSKLNHRILTASLTKKGEAALARGLAVAAAIEEKIWSGISTKALDGLTITLEHGIANLYGAIGSQQAAS